MEATRKAALAAGDTRYFTGKTCKHGHISPRRAATGECLQCRADALVAWRGANPDSVQKHNASQYFKFAEKIRERSRVYNAANAFALNAKKRVYQKKNLHLFAKSKAKRKAATMQRTPAWLTEDDHWMIGQAYELAALRTKLFGFAWHVDHKIPLQGKTVSGLHTPLNLQVIPATDNIRKGNRFEVAL
jgi:hypothetical protein